MSSRRHLVKETRVVATVAASDDCTMAAKSNVVISILRLPIPHDYILRRLDDGYRKWERFSAQDRRRRSAADISHGRGPAHLEDVGEWRGVEHNDDGVGRGGGEAVGRGGGGRREE